jgi:FkbM family methyltransferase
MLYKLAGVNPLIAAYKQMGVLKYENDDISGEAYFIREVLPKHVSKNALLIDVGAHVGKYALRLSHTFPEARILAFEPNPITFVELGKNIGSTKVESFNFALSSEVNDSEIFTYGDSQDSEHSSVYQAVMTDIHTSKNAKALPIKLTTLVDFCKAKGIESVDFLKIDTEGHELEVLKGAKEMLAAGKIKLIQFEFNEMNIISRVFLKDFYDLMPNYDFFRLDSKCLIPLGAYSSMNEIFHFQNIIAIPQNTP